MRWTAVLALAASAAGCALPGPLARQWPATRTASADTAFAVVRVAGCMDGESRMSVPVADLDIDFPLVFVKPELYAPGATVCEISGQWPNLFNHKRQLWISTRIFRGPGNGATVAVWTPIDRGGRISYRASGPVEVWTWVCRAGAECAAGREGFGEAPVEPDTASAGEP